MSENDVVETTDPEDILNELQGVRQRYLEQASWCAMAYDFWIVGIDSISEYYGVERHKVEAYKSQTGWCHRLAAMSLSKIDRSLHHMWCCDVMIEEQDYDSWLGDLVWKLDSLESPLYFLLAELPKFRSVCISGLEGDLRCMDKKIDISPGETLGREIDEKAIAHTLSELREFASRHRCFPTETLRQWLAAKPRTELI